MKTTPPVRTHPREVGLNALGKLKGFITSRNIPAEEIIAQIEAAKPDVPDRMLLHRALHHLDERVPIAAIQHWRFSIPPEYKWALYQRGHKTAKAERIIWHPLFDTLARYNAWPWPNFDTGADRNDVRTKSIHEYIEPLRHWLRQQTDPAQIEPLLEFRSYDIMCVVAQHAGVMTKELAMRLPLQDLIMNPIISQDLVDWIMERALLIHTKRAENIPEIGYLLARWGLGDNYTTTKYACSVFDNCLEAGRRVSQEFIVHLANEIQGEHARAYLNAFWDLDFTTQSRVMTELATANEVVFRTALIHMLRRHSDELVEAILDQTQNIHDAPWLERVRRHHLDDIITTLIKSKTCYSMSKLLEHPPAAKDSRLHRALADSPMILDVKTLSLLAMHAEGDARTYVFQRLARELKERGSVREFFTMFLRTAPEGITSLRDEDFLPLLQSEKASERMEAILVIDQIKKLAKQNDAPTLVQAPKPKGPTL